MPDYAKLITELEANAGPFKDDLCFRAAAALRVLTAQTETATGDDKIPYKTIVDLYNATVKGTYLPPAKGLAGGRRRLIAQRWQEHKESQTVEWWANFWKRVVASDFLAGRTPPSAGHENWRPNFDWFVTSRNFLKIIEGVYDNRGPRIDAGAIARFR